MTAIRNKLGFGFAFAAWVAVAECFAGSDSARLSWPPAPAEPSVVYSRAISGPADIGAKSSAKNRLATFLTGVESEKPELLKPFALALDSNGNLLVTDTELGAVLLLDRKNKKWLRWDSVEKIRFSSPVAVAAHGDEIYVADSGLAAVIGFTQKGRLLFQTGAELQRPTGLAVLGDKLYITDAQQHQVLVCDLTGHIVSRFGKRGGAAGEFNFPSHICVDAQGNLCVTDSLNYRVQVFDAQGRFLRSIGSAGDAPGHFSRPKGAAADSFGHLYVVDGLFDNIQIFDTAGRLLLSLGESGTDPGEFWLPNAIAINRDNEIFVADTYNHRIQVFQFTGKQ